MRYPIHNALFFIIYLLILLLIITYNKQDEGDIIDKLIYWLTLVNCIMYIILGGTIGLIQLYIVIYFGV